MEEEVTKRERVAWSDDLSHDSEEERGKEKFHYRFHYPCTTVTLHTRAYIGPDRKRIFLEMQRLTYLPIFIRSSLTEAVNITEASNIIDIPTRFKSFDIPK